MKTKQISLPDSAIGYRILKPLELNAIRFADKRTLLTPELLERMASAARDNTKS